MLTIGIKSKLEDNEYNELLKAIKGVVKADISVNSLTNMVGIYWEFNLAPNDKRTFLLQLESNKPKVLPAK